MMILVADRTHGSATFCRISTGVGSSPGFYALLYRMRKNFQPFVHSARLGLTARHLPTKKRDTRSNGFAGFSNNWRRTRLMCLCPIWLFRQHTTRGVGYGKLAFPLGICHVGADHFLYPGFLDEFVLGRAAYQVSAFVCMSKYLEQDVLKRRPEGILVRRIPCGVSIPEDVAKKPNGRLRLAYVGRLAEEAKRISEVTRALCRAVREVPGTEAFIYGDGEDRSAVEHI